MLTDGQALALDAIEISPCAYTTTMSGAGFVNVRAAQALIARGFAHETLTLLGKRVSITASGREALAAAIEHERSRRQLHRSHKISRRGMQPLGSLCQHCHYRTARPNKRYPNLATNYCSDDCRQADSHADRDDTARGLADEIRVAVGLPAGRGKHFTTPELRVIRRALIEPKRRSHYGRAQKRAS